MLLILFNKATEWDSCKDINSSLIKVYKEINAKLEVFYVSDSADSGKSLLKKITNHKRIVFLDHQVRVSKELYYLVNELDQKKISGIHFIFHIYGCFVDRFIEWEFIAKHLKGAKVDFVASSSAQAAVVDKCLNLKSKTLLLPFPVDEKKMKPDVFTKKSLGINNNEKVVLYAGRISPGKNVIPLMESVYRINQTENEKVHLIVIGSIDDMAWPNGKESLKGFMSHELSKNLKRINNDKKIIHFIPHTANKGKLYGLYKIVDVVASLGTMVYEDYGMSIADAVVLNKKILCTAWGGYKDFGKFTSNISYVNVQNIEKNFCLDNKEIDNCLLNLLKQKKIIQYKGGLGIKELSKSLENQLVESSSRINGVSKKGKLFQLMNIFEILEGKRTRKIYESYWI